MICLISMNKICCRIHISCLFWSTKWVHILSSGWPVHLKCAIEDGASVQSLDRQVSPTGIGIFPYKANSVLPRLSPLSSHASRSYSSVHGGSIDFVGAFLKAWRCLPPCALYLLLIVWGFFCVVRMLQPRIQKTCVPELHTPRGVKRLCQNST